MKKSEQALLLKLLGGLYPEPRSELNFSNDYQLTICVILSAQCTDKKVNEVTPALFSRYPDFRSLAKGRVVSVEKIIRQVNYYRTKARNIIAASKQIMERFSGKLPDTHPDLISLPGIGQKTANVILGERGVAATFPVDTHVFRVSKRLGLASGKTPEKVEEELKQRFQKRYWRFLHHALILHGRRVCKAQRPLCGECKLKNICDYFDGP
ncbi:MAG: endonuclease III [Proteobacteria bacterium]|nr:MAG: endonuclease III [Pseudomonadota bacterium]